MKFFKKKLFGLILTTFTAFSLCANLNLDWSSLKYAEEVQAETETNIYHAVDLNSYSATKVYVNVRYGGHTSDPWGTFLMTNTGKTYNNLPVYKANFTDKWDCLGVLQFLYKTDDDTQKDCKEIFRHDDGSSTSPSVYNNKLWLDGGTSWINDTFNYSVTCTPDENKKGCVSSIQYVSEGGSVTVNATPKCGYVFDYWENNGSAVSTSSSYTVENVHSNVSLVAHFKDDELVEIYFTNNYAWTTPSVYQFNSINDVVAWPGTQMIYFGTNKAGQWIYKTNVFKNTTLIINNGKSGEDPDKVQTVNINNQTDGIGYYITGGSGTSHTVGTYTLPLYTISCRLTNETEPYYVFYEKYDIGFYLDANLTEPITPGTTTGSTITWKTKPTKTGYTLDGFYTGTNGTGTKYINSKGNLINTSTTKATTFNSNTNLYANWVPNDYTLEWNFNGGTPSGDYTPAGDVKYDKVLLAPTITKDGYTFTGWSFSQSGGKYGDTTECTSSIVAKDTPYGQTLTPFYFKNLRSAATKGTVTVSANWTPANYNLKIYANNETENYQTTTATYNSSTISPNITTPIYTGHTLNGYYSAATGGVEVINSEGTLIPNVAGYTDENGYWKRSSNTDLYAQWTANTYNLASNTTNCTSKYYSDIELTTEITSATYGTTLYYLLTASDGYLFNASKTKSDSLILNDSNFVLSGNVATHTFEEPQTGLFTIHLDDGSGAGNFDAIYEKYLDGFYLESSMTTKMTATTNPVTKFPTKTGYSFNGYYKDSVQYIKANGTIHGTNLKNNTFTEDVTLVPGWIANKYKVRGSIEHGTITWYSDKIDGTIIGAANTIDYDSTVYYRITPDFGYTIDEPLTGSITFNEQNGFVYDLTNKWYTKTFNNTSTAKIYTLTSANDRHYTWQWYSDSECTKAITTAEYGSTVYCRITANDHYVWEKQKTKTPSYILNSTNFSINDSTCTANHDFAAPTLVSTYNLKANLTRATVIFYSDSGFETEITQADLGSVVYYKATAKDGYSYDGSQYKTGSFTLDDNSGINYADTSANATLPVPDATAIYTIILNDNGGTGGSTNIFEIYYNGMYLNASDLTTLMTHETNSVNIPTKQYYTFTGYNTLQNGSGTNVIKNDGYIYAAYENGRYFTENNVSLFAQWSAKSYTLTSSLTNVTIKWYSDNTKSQEITVINADISSVYYELTTNTGYHFSDSTTVKNGTLNFSDFEISDLNNTASYTFNETVVANSHTLTWDFNGGSATSEDYTKGSVSYGTAIVAPIVTKIGYTFAGWSPAVASTMPDSDITYTAQWEAITYTITYTLNGGTVEGDNPTTYTIEDETITLINPTKTGYNFAGWTGTDLSSATVVVTIPTGSYGNRTYSATWENRVYRITLDANGGDCDTTYIYEKYGVGVYKDQECTIQMTDKDNKIVVTKTGYVLSSFNYNNTPYIKADGSVHVTNFNSWKAFTSDDITLTAVWAVPNYKVSVDGGSSYTAIQTIQQGPSGSMLYELRLENSINLHVGSRISFKLNDSVITSNISPKPDSGESHNNITIKGDYWYIHNDATSNIYLTITNNDGVLEYTFWVGGYADIFTGQPGFSSGSTFYLKDSINWAGNDAILKVYFRGPYNQLTTTEDIAVIMTRIGTSNIYSCTVPTMTNMFGDTINVSWHSVYAKRYKNDGTTEWNHTDCLNMEYGYHNAIDITSWIEKETKCSAVLFLYSDGGIESDNGIYFDIANAKSADWKLTGDNKLFVYFIGTYGNSNEAVAWSSPMTLVPGYETLYEVNIPKSGDTKVQWLKITIVRTTATGVWPSDTKMQTVDIIWSSAIANNRHITFASTLSSDNKQNVICDSDYIESNRVEDYGTNFLKNCATCDSTGSTKGITAIQWSTCKTEYENMCINAQGLFWTAIGNQYSEKASEQAAARYDYLVGKYGTDEKTGYPDYANRLGSVNYSYNSLSRYNGVFDSIINDNSLMIIIVIATSITLISLSGIGLYFVLKKKKLNRK